MRVFFFTFLLFFCSFTAWTEEISLIEIAVPTDFPPFAFVEKGELKGFDIDLLNAVASRLKKTIKFLPMKSNYVISAVASNLADLGAGGLSITEKRKEYVDFTTPYFDSGFVLVIRKNYEDLDINKLHDKKIGTYISDLTRFYMDTLNLDKNIISGEYNLLFNELISGGIDTVFIDYPAAKYMVSHYYKDTLKLTGPLYFQQQYGYVIRKKHPLKKDIDRAIENILNSSTYQSIYTKWFGE